LTSEGDLGEGGGWGAFIQYYKSNAPYSHANSKSYNKFN